MSPPIKIYVGNIPGSARNSELKELFEKFGKVVECDILKDFGFVHMDDTNDAKAAIAGLNDTLWKGSRIRVELSTTKTSKGEPSQRYKGPPSDYRGGYRGPPPPHMMHRDSPYGMPPHRIPRNGHAGGGGGPIRHDRYGAPPNGRYMERGRPYPPEPYDRRGGMPPPPRGEYAPYARNGGSNGAGPDMRGGSGDHRSSSSLGPGGGMDNPYMRGPPHPGMGPPPQSMHHHDDYYRGGPPSGPPSMPRYDFDPYGAPSRGSLKDDAYHGKSTTSSYDDPYESSSRSKHRRSRSRSDHGRHRRRRSSSSADSRSRRADSPRRRSPPPPPASTDRPHRQRRRDASSQSQSPPPARSKSSSQKSSSRHHKRQTSPSSSRSRSNERRSHTHHRRSADREFRQHHAQQPSQSQHMRTPSPVSVERKRSRSTERRENGSSESKHRGSSRRGDSGTKNRRRSSISPSGSLGVNSPPRSPSRS